MNQTLKVSLIAIILLGLGFLVFQNKNTTKTDDESVKSGDYFPIPGIEVDENYGKDFKTYESNLGFSFKYPPHLEILIDPEEPNRIILTPKDLKTEEGVSAVIISASENNENMTPQEWLLGPTSGFKHSDDYFKTTIDGQDAVYTDGGMWTVVNTRDNKYRLSVADIATGGRVLFTEVGIVTESLTFK